MNETACQNTQGWLLESETCRPTPAQLQHLRACPACRAFSEDIASSGAALQRLARETERRSHVELPPELKTRVFEDLVEKLSKPERKPAGAADRALALAGAKVTPHAAPRAVEGAVRRALRGGSRWAAAACLLILAGAMTALTLGRNASIGNLEYADGETSMRTKTATQTHNGLGQWSYRSGATLSTAETAAAVFSVGSGVHAAMAGGTSVQLLARERLALTRGSVWLSVTPGGKGFEVQTPYALVKVTGTKFGVTVADGETRVDVAEGSVAVSRAQGAGRVAAGQTMIADSDGIAGPTPRKEGEGPPVWVNDLLTAEKIAQAGKYLPSLGK